MDGNSLGEEAVPQDVGVRPFEADQAQALELEELLDQRGLRAGNDERRVEP